MAWCLVTQRDNFTNIHISCNIFSLLSPAHTPACFTWFLPLGISSQLYMQFCLAHAQYVSMSSQYYSFCNKEYMFSGDLQLRCHVPNVMSYRQSILFFFSLLLSPIPSRSGKRPWQNNHTVSASNTGHAERVRDSLFSWNQRKCEEQLN